MTPNSLLTAKTAAHLIHEPATTKAATEPTAERTCATLRVVAAKALTAAHHGVKAAAKAATHVRVEAATKTTKTAAHVGVKAAEATTKATHHGVITHAVAAHLAEQTAQATHEGVELRLLKLLVWVELLELLELLIRAEPLLLLHTCRR